MTTQKIPEQTPDTSRNHPVDLLRLLRPHQWIKNGLVLIGLLFGNVWHDASLVAAVLLTLLAFCLASSGVYIINDLFDREQDRRHPVKCRRPLAAGTVSVNAAVALAVLLGFGAIALALLASPAAAWIILAYWVLNAAYSTSLKHMVLLDVFAIAGGFMLRIFAGTLGVGIAPSEWLVLCGLMLTLFLGFTKRRAEIMALERVDGAQAPGSHRRVLDHYTPALLDKMIGISASAVIISFSLYTMSPATVELHGTSHLIYTVPFVLYGVFRYIYLLHEQRAGGDTASDLLRDKHLLVTVAAWFGVTLWLITG